MPNLSNSLFPGYGLEFSLSLFPDPLQGGLDPNRRVNPLIVMPNLMANDSARKRVIRIPGYSLYSPVFHLYQEAAGVWAVMRANRTFHLFHVFSFP
jgi:hypothetical protein